MLTFSQTLLVACGDHAFLCQACTVVLCNLRCGKNNSLRPSYIRDAKHAGMLHCTCLHSDQRSPRMQESCAAKQPPWLLEELVSMVLWPHAWKVRPKNAARSHHRIFWRDPNDICDARGGLQAHPLPQNLPSALSLRPYPPDISPPRKRQHWTAGKHAELSVSILARGPASLAGDRALKSVTRPFLPNMRKYDDLQMCQMHQC